MRRVDGDGDRWSSLLMNDTADYDDDNDDDDDSAIAAADSLVVLHACPPDHQGGWSDCRRIGASKTKDTQNSDISAPPSSSQKRAKGSLFFFFSFFPALLLSFVTSNLLTFALTRLLLPSHEIG